MPQIKWMTGDIFESKCQIITVTVNCVGVMGAGIAKTCKQKFPATFQLYKQKCKAGEYIPGQPHLVSVDRPLLLFPTKNHWRNPSQMVWIEKGLQRIVNNAHRIESIAIPPLGCGHGGLNWIKVKALIQKYLEPLQTVEVIEVYEPKQKQRGYRTEYSRKVGDRLESQLWLENIRIAVTGGRDYQDKATVFAALDKMNKRHGVVELIHGGARGADSLAGAWAKARGIKTSVFIPKWDQYGKRAGILRNQLMLDQSPDAVIAFPGGRGTAHMVKASESQGINLIHAETLIKEQ